MWTCDKCHKKFRFMDLENSVVIIHLFGSLGRTRYIHSDCGGTVWPYFHHEQTNILPNKE